MQSYFKCGLCDHTQPSRDDVYGWEIDLSHMFSHYSWDHSSETCVKRRVPGVAFGDWYELKPLPDDIGPSFVDGDSGQSYDWPEVRKYRSF